jgi:hypothetical protein
VAAKTPEEIEKRLGKGSLSILDLYGMFEKEQSDYTHLLRAEQTYKRGVGDRPARSSDSVVRVAGSMRLGQVLRAVPGIGEKFADLILREYDLDGETRIEEVGTAEAMLLDSAVRLVTHTPKKGAG